MICHPYLIVKTPARLAQEFSDFFHDKIYSIILQLKPTSDCPIDNRYIEDEFLTQYHIHEFHEVREAKVLKLLTTSPAKSCELYPFQSKLLAKALSRSCSNAYPNC